MTTLAHPTLAQTLWPSESPALRAITLAVAGSVLMTLSAKMHIPFWPVPMTLQTFVVLVLGAAYGWKLGAATMLLYLAEGAIGLPVFSGTPERGIGLAYMAGPTGGYLAGFVAGAALCGWLAERGWDRSWWRSAIAMSLGHVVILVAGWAWLATLMGAEKAFAAGIAPFYAATVAKTAMAVLALPLAWKALKRA
ncbi:MAG TPA: biotin transporter BioY [Burkholderiales bacterium]|nr:biotin transporter BioY [Burkholderiales bacterium]